MLSTKFQFIWESGFREDFLEINQSKTRMACGGHGDDFLAHHAKGNVSFCHHLASVVHKLFTF
jgi:hypothetical protein